MRVKNKKAIKNKKVLILQNFQIINRCCNIKQNNKYNQKINRKYKNYYKMKININKKKK